MTVAERGTKVAQAIRFNKAPDFASVLVNTTQLHDSGLLFTIMQIVLTDVRLKQFKIRTDSVTVHVQVS
jgi:hypothetical protein